MINYSFVCWVDIITVICFRLLGNSNPGAIASNVNDKWGEKDFLSTWDW